MNPIEIHVIPALSDNYIYLLQSGKHGLVIDPGEAPPVRQKVQELGLDIHAIALTHPHHDHTAGAAELKQCWHCAIYSPASAGPAAGETAVIEGDVLPGDFPLEVLDTPGHGPCGMTYALHPCNRYPSGALFCGDALFSIGCGRLFGQAPSVLFNSLQKLKAFPDATELYLGHEYTLTNIRFALSLQPDHPGLLQLLQETEQKRARGIPSLPSTLGRERALNPFLRTAEPGLVEAVGMKGASELEVFTRLRALRDQW